MFRDIESQDNYYLISCADNEFMVLSDSFNEAANNGLKNILSNKGIKTNLSFLMSVDLIKNSEIETKIFYTPNILHDLGYFKLAKDLSELSDFFLDKGKNPH